MVVLHTALTAARSGLLEISERDGLAFLVWGAVGAVATFLARFVSPDFGGASRGTFLVGVAGAVALGVVACLFVGPPRNFGLSPGSILVAALGAAAFLYAYSLIVQKTV